MRVGREKSEPKEALFKVFKKAKEQKDHQDNSSCESDHELAQFYRKLKCFSRKYKGKFPFKWFEYERVRRFLSQFPYKEITKKEDDHKFRNKSQKHQNKFYKKKGLYSKEDSLTPELDNEKNLEDD